MVILAVMEHIQKDGIKMPIIKIDKAKLADYFFSSKDKALRTKIFKHLEGEFQKNSVRDMNRSTITFADLYWMSQSFPVNIVLNPEKLPEDRVQKHHFRTSSEDGVELENFREFIKVDMKS
jgi:hypothetical protein